MQGMMELELKSCFPEAYTVSIASVCQWEEGYGVLLTIWETDEYSARWNMLIKISGGEITHKYYFDKEIKWLCAYGLGKGKYLLGSFNRGSKPAILSLFQREKLLKTRYFDKGYATEICSIERTIDNDILVEGEFCTIEPAGGHDEYYAHKWTQKITANLEDSEGTTIVNSQVCYEEGMTLGDEEGCFFTYDQYRVGKYNNAEELLWEQDTAITGEERSSKLLNLAPYHFMREDKLFMDGIWAGGKRNNVRGSGMYCPTLFRLSSGGTLLNFSKYLEAIPHLQSVLSIMPGMDKSCYVLGETLVVGEGNGLCMVYVDLAPHVVIKSVRYVNLHESGLPPIIDETPSFCGKFINIVAVYQEVEEERFVVFLNTSENGRCYGKVWSLSLIE